MKLLLIYVKRGKCYCCRLTSPTGLMGTLTLTEAEFAYMREEYPEWDWLDDEQQEAA